MRCNNEALRMGTLLNLNHFRRLFRTLCDIGVIRLSRRVRYELRHYLDRQLSPSFAAFLSGCYPINCQWQTVLSDLAIPELTPPEHVPPHSVNFNFLNLEKQLCWPIIWNDPNWPRLWQFHLHYFDWAREWLEDALTTGQWPHQASLLEYLIDHWIESNPPGRGDGWHSYTLSLRIRNWIWLFRVCPYLVNSQRIASLWQQLLWLQAHPEHCHGGNHWIENLTALALGGLQFTGVRAQSLHRRAMRLLRQELSTQVLADGGHEERSASYHLLILARLVELGCVLSSINGQRPSWLISSIESMATWAKNVRLEGGITRGSTTVPRAQHLL